MIRASQARYAGSNPASRIVLKFLDLSLIPMTRIERRLFDKFIEKLTESDIAFMRKDVDDFANKTKGIGILTLRYFIEENLGERLYEVRAIDAFEDKRKYKLRLPEFLPFRMKRKTKLLYVDANQIREWFKKQYLEKSNYVLK